MPRITQTQEVNSQPGPSSSNAATNRPSTDAFVYNPRQTDSDRRKVRSDYRQLIAQAEESKRDSSLKPADLLSLIRKADELHERVVAPSESILDTKTLSSMSEMGARMAKKIKLNQDAFDTQEFITRLARFLGGEAAPLRGSVARDDSDDEQQAQVDRWEWQKLSQLSSSLSRRAITIDFLLGPLKIQTKQRRVIQRRQEEAPTERTAPRALQQQDLQNTAGRESTHQILQVAKLLTQQGPHGICLFKFAVDPESFVNTVENFFHVSFLIKENKARLRTDAEGNAVLSIAQPPVAEGEEGGQEGEEEGEGRSKQFIMEIDYQTYLETIELYRIRESVIPTRANRVDGLGGREALHRARGSQG